MITPEMLKQIMDAHDDLDGRGLVSVTMLNILKEIGIDKVEVSYRGSGDSPDESDGELWILKGIVDGPTNEAGETLKTEDWEVLAQADPKREKFEPYFHLFIQFIDTLSYDNWGGWYNNDGGYGTGTFLVKTDNPRVVIDHYAYVQEEVFEGEFNYSAAAAEDIEDAA